MLNKDEWLKSANDKLDIPKLNEAEEAKLMDSLYVAVLEALTQALERI